VRKCRFTPFNIRNKGKKAGGVAPVEELLPSKREASVQEKEQGKRCPPTIWFGSSGQYFKKKKLECLFLIVSLCRPSWP
jgi:hypothetical protein